MDFIIEKEQIYSVNEENKRVAEILFPQTEPGVYCITHTFVDDSLTGQGIAGKLVQMAVDRIRENGGKVTATCSYAEHWLAKHQ